MTNAPEAERPKQEAPRAMDEVGSAASFGQKRDHGTRDKALHTGSPVSSGGTAEGGTVAPAPDRQAENAPSSEGRRRRRRRKARAASSTDKAGLPATATSRETAMQSARTPASPGAAALAGIASGENADAGETRKKRKRRRRNGQKGAGRAEGGETVQRALQGKPVGPKQPHAKARDRGSMSDGRKSERRQADHSDRPPVPLQTARAQHPDLYAALDLGTNNCRLLIAQPTRPGQFRVVDAFSRIVRLGEGFGATGRLSDAAMDRAIEALKICASKLENRPLRRRRLIATEACRSAENGESFLVRVREETGLELEIVNRETEARLAVSGCSSLVGRETDGLVLFDIGGGSSEIAMIDLTAGRSNRLSDHIRAWTSLPVGVVTLSERHGGCHVTPEVFEAMVAEVDEMLAGFEVPDLPAFAPGAGTQRIHLLGTSGTVTTLAGLHLDLPRYDRRKVDGLWLTNDDVDRMLERLLSWDFDARAANPCIGTDRADLVLAGCAILQSIRKRWPSERMRVADRGLREGLLNEMMAGDGAWRRSRNRFRQRLQQRTGENRS